MDNLTSHKGPQVKKLIEEKGCELLNLPSYSPDFNSIEEAFAKIKGALRRAEARSRDALIEAMGRALEAVTASDARGFFEHRGLPATGSTTMTNALGALYGPLVQGIRCGIVMVRG